MAGKLRKRGGSGMRFGGEREARVGFSGEERENDGG